jgi:hypothetical protein
MQTQFVQTDTRKAAANACPWAAVIVKVCGGYMCFESRADYATWRGQQ